MKIQFTAELVAGHKGVTAVIVPFDPRQAWGREPVPLDDRRSGWLVRGRVNGARFQGWIGLRWGKHFIILDEAARAAAGAAVGDTLEVVVEPTASRAALDVAHEQARLTTAPARRRGAETSAQRLARLLGGVDPAAKGVRAALRRRLPGAVELVDERRGALVIAFARGERLAGAVATLRADARRTTLAFPGERARAVAGPAALDEEELLAKLAAARKALGAGGRRRTLFKTEPRA